MADQSRFASKKSSMATTVPTNADSGASMRASISEYKSTAVSGTGLRTRQERTSADFLERKILTGTPARQDFTTIVPYGLPADVVGDDVETRVERHNVLTEPGGVKNAAARLPPYKPFKTISDEDNIHLLPTETGERTRLNLLDTKAVTRKDIEEVKEALDRSRSLHPDLYNKPQEELEEESVEEEKEIVKKVVLPPPRPVVRRSAAVSKEYESYATPSYKTSYESSYESSSEEEYDDDAYARWYQQYMQAMQGGGCGNPGFPAGYGMPCGPYPGGFGPCQVCPSVRPCYQEVQVGDPGAGDGGVKKRQKLKRPQGLDFDFLPHEDLATEVTFTIEPDDPEPLQYAVENGVMPIICCYMPSSLAVSQNNCQPQQGSSAAKASYAPSYSGSPSSASYYRYNQSRSYAPSYGYSDYPPAPSGITKTGTSKTDSLLPNVEEEDLPPLQPEEQPRQQPQTFGAGTSPAPATF